jgi:hypothetical protein
MHRVAISNRRLLPMEDGCVTFAYTDWATRVAFMNGDDADCRTPLAIPMKLPNRSASWPLERG